MKIIRIVGICPMLLFLIGCGSNIARYYKPLPDVTNVEVNDYVGPLKAERLGNMDINQLIGNMLAEDYVLIGTADFTGDGSKNWCGAMVRLGQKLMAEKIYYSSSYHSTDYKTGCVSMPTTYNSTATIWGASGPRTVNVSTMGTTAIPYSYSVPRNAFNVFYFKKLKEAPKFGMYFGSPDEEMARKIGTRNAIVISRVVRGKIAWKNDLFEGDIILEVDGKKATHENVLAFSKDCHNKTIKIRRDEKELCIKIDAMK